MSHLPEQAKLYLVEFLNNKNVKLEIYLPYNKQTIFCKTNFNLI